MVFIHNAGIRLVDEWIDHPNVTAVMFAHLPGQDTGRALAQIIYGDVSPSGKLPYTVAKKEEDYSVGPPAVAEGMYSLFPQTNFTEGVYIDYRHFDKANITPRFEFGYGMTYTTFEYSKLDISPASKLSKQPERPPAQRTRPGGNPALWNVLATVTVRVENTGKFEAAEIAQLYVRIPGGDTPVRQLRGFDKQVIPKGHKKTFSFELTRKDLSVWDVVKQDWVLRRGNYTIFVGASSRNLPLADTLVI
jgi:beta-glucosidase